VKAGLSSITTAGSICTMERPVVVAVLLTTVSLTAPFSPTVFKETVWVVDGASPPADQVSTPRVMFSWNTPSRYTMTCEKPIE